MDVRDICGPKKSHYGNKPTSQIDPNVIAGMRKSEVPDQNDKMHDSFKHNKN